MSIATLFSHEAREHRAVEHLVFHLLAKNGYPETALLMADELKRDPAAADPTYRLTFATWESDEQYQVIAEKAAGSWRVALQIGDQAPRDLQ